jgi:hypothetical protein
MKTRKKVYIISGIVLILYNIIGYLGTYVTPGKRNINDDLSGDIYGVIVYFIGFNFGNIIGIILLIMAYNVSKKIKRKADQELVNQIGTN